MIYFGLTDLPQKRRAEHGSPPDWQQIRFNTEQEARDWEAKRLSQPGHRGGVGGSGWRFGYWYTITVSTKQ